MAQFTIGGVQFELTREEVQAKLRSVTPEPVRELFIDVNGTRYPIKQALSETAGLQRGMFTSHDAIRVFRKLSIPEPAGPCRKWRHRVYVRPGIYLQESQRD